MTVLLDENFPLGLVPVLQAAGLEVEHIITLGWRGAPDSRIRERLQDPELIFVTQDDDFLFRESVRAIVLLSRVRQARPIRERVGVWRRAVQELLQHPGKERLFELLDDGTLLPWREG